MAKAVKLADIAQKLNVSNVTVSKALSDQKGVSEELRAKIKQVAEEMGYRSLTVAKMENANKSYNIGVVVAERYVGKYESFYWQMYQEIATKAVSKKCFTMLEIISAEDENNLIMPKLLKEEKVDGIIILGIPHDDYLAAFEVDVKVPYMYMDFYSEGQNCDSVVTDNYYGMYKLVDYLISMGHREIGYVGTLKATSSITDRYFGYCKALLEHDITLEQNWIISDRDKTGRVGLDTIELPQKLPTAFACNNDLTAAYVIKLLNNRGIRVPEDISVTGFDNFLYPGLCDIAITSYEVDIKEMARKCVNKLLKKMSGERGKQEITIVDGRLIYTDSVKRIN